MVIVSFYSGGGFLKAYIVEAGERSSVNIFDRMIWNEEVFFPSHEHKVSILYLVIVECIRVKRLCILAKR